MSKLDPSLSPFQRGPFTWGDLLSVRSFPFVVLVLDTPPLLVLPGDITHFYTRLSTLTFDRSRSRTVLNFGFIPLTELYFSFSFSTLPKSFSSPSLKSQKHNGRYSVSTSTYVELIQDRMWKNTVIYCVRVKGLIYTLRDLQPLWGIWFKITRILRVHSSHKQQYKMIFSLLRRLICTVVYLYRRDKTSKFLHFIHVKIELLYNI